MSDTDRSSSLTILTAIQAYPEGVSAVALAGHLGLPIGTVSARLSKLLSYGQIGRTWQPRCHAKPLSIYAPLTNGGLTNGR